VLTVHDLLHHCHSLTTYQLHQLTSWQVTVQNKQHKRITGRWILSARYMVQNVLSIKHRQKPTGNFSRDVNGMHACNAQQQPIIIKISITFLFQSTFPLLSQIL